MLLTLLRWMQDEDLYAYVQGMPPKSNVGTLNFSGYYWVKYTLVEDGNMLIDRNRRQ